VTRHPALVPLSHDHHHALVQARRLQRAAEGGAAARRAAAERFLRFFSEETVRHFREEEERLFPALVGAADPAGELLVQALLDHQRLHALVARLDRELTQGDADPALMGEVGRVLTTHVRFEERRLFPLVQKAVPETLGRLALAEACADAGPVIDLLAPRGRGPLWGAATDDLNATLLAWDPRDGPSEHVNAERDVLLLVLGGSATVTIDGTPNAVHAGDALILEKGRSRSIAAGPEGVRYLSVHRRRAPLQIAPAPGGPTAA
jgi:mannose-6-phosphate isomerase-like protein (cupin superfamily)